MYPIYHFYCGCITSEFLKLANGPVICRAHKKSYKKKIIKCAGSPKKQSCPVILELTPTQARKQRCPECQHEQKLQIGREYCKKGGTRPRNARLKSSKVKDRDKPIGRICRRCGGNPWPNYFFCKSCHSSIGETEYDPIHDEHTALPGMVDRALAW